MTHTVAAKARKVADLTWDVVAKRLKGGAAALLPIGAGAKQHGLHMRMATDQVLAEYFAGVVAEETNSLIWPTLTYGAYPAFVAYAGSASLSNATFQSVVTEIADALLGFGAERVLILDTGISTLAPVEAAIKATSNPSRIRHLKVFAGPRFIETAKALQQQPYGSHADEIETSLMLAIAPGLGRHEPSASFALLAWRPSARTALAERPEFAQLFAERQLRRSDAGLGREGQDNSRGHRRGLDGGGGLIRED